MTYGGVGVRRTIALALGLAPLMGCSARVVDDDDFVASSGSSTTGTPNPTTAPTSDPSTTDATDPSGGSVDDGGESSSGFATTGTSVRDCVSDGYPMVDLCWGEPIGGSCECDGECQWLAASIANETFPQDFGCGFYPGEVACSELWEGECCYSVRVYEDACGKGRPLVVDDRTRVAPLCAGADWGSAQAVHDLPEVAAYWLEAGLEEHASVASFARFALELVAVGAPPELLADTAAAMRDEVRHAELAFGLAQRFGASAQQPGALDAGPARGTTLREVIVATVREGCVGETLAAAQAELAAARATDPAVARALGEIAADEARHAALAWRVVQWALSVDPSLRGAVADAFAEADLLVLAPTEPASAGLEAYGVLSGDATEAVRAQAMRDTVRPFADALVSPRSDRPVHAASRA